MSAVKVKDELVARIRTGAYDMIVCNLPTVTWSATRA